MNPRKKRYPRRTPKHKKKKHKGIFLPARIREYYETIFLQTPFPFIDLDGSMSLRYKPTQTPCPPKSSEGGFTLRRSTTQT
jgi:hypothetical protein